MSRNCFLMTGKAVKLTTRIGFVGSAAFEFTFRTQLVVTTLSILETDVFDRCGKGVARWVYRCVRPNHDVSFDGVAGSITRQGWSAFADAVTKDPVAVRATIRDVVCVDEAGRRLAVQ